LGTTREDLRGSGGKIALLPVAWKAATLVAPGRALRTKACRRITGLLNSVEGVIGCLNAGVAEELVDRNRLDVRDRHDCRTIEGLMREAILI
jgi:hypothetical protein